MIKPIMSYRTIKYCLYDQNHNVIHKYTTYKDALIAAIKENKKYMVIDNTQESYRKNEIHNYEFKWINKEVIIDLKVLIDLKEEMLEQIQESQFNYFEEGSPFTRAEKN